MLNRFKDTGENTALRTEVLNVMQAYADFHNELSHNYHPMHRMIAKITMQRLMQGATDEHTINVEAEVNAGLEFEFSAFTAAARGLESSLLAVKDWGISWRQFVRGEIIGQQKDASDEEMTFTRLVRAPSGFEESDGWINGADIGYNGDLGIICPYVQIKFDSSDGNGLYMSMVEMFEIELIPPDRES